MLVIGAPSQARIVLTRFVWYLAQRTFLFLPRCVVLGVSTGTGSKTHYDMIYFAPSMRNDILRPGDVCALVSTLLVEDRGRLASPLNPSCGLHLTPRKASSAQSLCLLLLSLFPSRIFCLGSLVEPLISAIYLTNRIRTMRRNGFLLARYVFFGTLTRRTAVIKSLTNVQLFSLSSQS